MSARADWKNQYQQPVVDGNSYEKGIGDKTTWSLRNKWMKLDNLKTNNNDDVLASALAKNDNFLASANNNDDDDDIPSNRTNNNVGKRTLHPKAEKANRIKNLRSDNLVGNIWTNIPRFSFSKTPTTNNNKNVAKKMTTTIPTTTTTLTNIQLNQQKEKFPMTSQTQQWVTENENLERQNPVVQHIGSENQNVNIKNFSNNNFSLNNFSSKQNNSDSSNQSNNMTSYSMNNSSHYSKFQDIQKNVGLNLTIL